MSEKKNVIITVAADAEPRMAQIADEIRAAGFEVNAVMEDMGIITGKVAPHQLNAVRCVQGIEAIEEDTEMSAI